MRLVLTVLGEAERFGAVPANRVEATALTGDGALVRDVAGGGEFAVRAANVVNATGVWADRLRPDELHDEAEVPVIRPSRGTHIVLPAALLPRRRGRDRAGRRTGARSSCCPGSARRWSARPTTTTTATSSTCARRTRTWSTCSMRVNAFFATELGAGDVAGAYAGVRPLISTGDPKKSVDISRKAELYETSSGMITITGGKLTTWRRMAKLAVDRIVERDGRDAPCRTHEIPLGMAVDDAGTAARGGRAGARPTRSSPAATATPRATSWRSRPSAASSRQPILAGPSRPAGRGRLRRAARAGAQRRRRAAAPHAARAHRRAALCAAGEQAPERVAAAIGDELGWDGARVRAEAAAFRAEAAAEGIVVARVSAPARVLRARRRGGSTLAGAPLLMGIVNATPDSFSDAGELPDVAARVARARELVAAGARIVDVGGGVGVRRAPAGARRRGGRARRAR